MNFSPGKYPSLGIKEIGTAIQWRMQVLKKKRGGGAPIHDILKLTDFGLNFTLNKSIFSEKEGMGKLPF